jgi:hypothetical protein
VAFIKNSNSVINIKLTTKGRDLLSQGNLNFKYFGFGDSEIDYNNSIDIPKILMSLDKNPNVISYIKNNEIIGDNTLTPLISKTSKERIIYNELDDLGFFDADNQLIQSGSSYTKQPNIQINIDEVVGGNSLNLYKSSSYINSSLEPSVGDIILVKWINKRGINSNNFAVNNPLPFLFYKITGITSGLLSTNNLIIEVDRELPDFTLVTGSTGKIAGAIVYNTARFTGNTITSTDYTYNSLLNIINNSQCNIEKPFFWNMDIIYTEEIAGVKSNNNKYQNLNSSGLTGFVSYIQEQAPYYKKLGVIHYSDFDPSNSYGEGFYYNTPVLKLPTIMWHKSNISSIGLILSGDLVQKKLSKLNISYYNLVDKTGNVVGKIFDGLKIFVIEDQDLLFAMSCKSNRNWTLPQIKVTVGDSNTNC